MKKSKLLMVVVAFFTLVALAYAANTTLMGAGSLTITGLDADWLWSSHFTATNGYPNGPKIKSIQFNPSAANDIMIVHEPQLRHVANTEFAEL